MTRTAPRYALIVVIGTALVALAPSLGTARASAPPGALTWVGWQEDGRTLRFTVRADGRGLRGEPVPRRMANVVASPDGRRIAYEYGRNVFVARRDGSRARRVAMGVTQPAWAPDSRRLVYKQDGVNLRRRQVEPGLFVRHIDGSGKRRLTTGRHQLPAWSPDGRTIAFVRHRNRQGCSFTSAVHVVRATGGRARRLLAPGYSCGYAGRPSWSPRGNRLVLELGRALAESDGRPRDHSTDAVAAERIGINVIRADGSARRRIAPAGQSPVWAPAGQTIAYHVSGATCDGQPAGQHTLCATTAAGGSPRPVATLPRQSANGLSWLPPLRRSAANVARAQGRGR